MLANYKGTLIDGTEFDSSYKRGKPSEFGVGEVIKGWTEVLQLMKVGDKWEVFIPSDMAYGPRQRRRDHHAEQHPDLRDGAGGYR